MHQFIGRKEYVKLCLRMVRAFSKPRPPNEFELAMEASRPKTITNEEWAEAARELDEELRVCSCKLTAGHALGCPLAEGR